MESGAEGRSSLWNIAVAVCLLCIVGLYVAHATLYWHYVNDDAYITFRYSARLAAGLGPYFNEGERVEGYTNLLLMLLISAAIRLFGLAAAAPTAKVIGLLAGTGCVILAFLLARALWPKSRPGAEAVSLGSAGLLACLPSFALNSVSGLETTLFALLVTWGVYCGVRNATDGRMGWGSAACFALAGLTRPEGFVIFGVFWLSSVAMLFRRKTAVEEPSAWALVRGRGFLGVALAVTAVFSLHLLCRFLVYDGEWLPNTFFAKIGGFAGISPWNYVRQGSLTPVFGVPGVLLGLAGLTRLAEPRRVLPPLIVAFFGAAEPWWAATDWMLGWRIVVPYLPLLVTTMVLGWSLLFSTPTVLRRSGAVLVLLLLPWSWLRHTPERDIYLSDTRIRARGYETGHRALARWLSQPSVTSPGDTVALLDIGIVGFVASDLKVLDVSGLTDRFIAKSPGVFMNKRFDLRYLFARAPRYIVLALTGPGISYVRPTGPVAFEPFTASERGLMDSPEFRRLYVHPRPSEGAPWPDDLAAKIGAERVFEHAYPRGRHYLLAAFRRQEPTAAP